MDLDTMIKSITLPIIIHNSLYFITKHFEGHKTREKMPIICCSPYFTISLMHHPIREASDKEIVDKEISTGLQLSQFWHPLSISIPCLLTLSNTHPLFWSISLVVYLSPVNHLSQQWFTILFHFTDGLASLPMKLFNICPVYSSISLLVSPLPAISL